jgi:hypothetical protein
MNATLPLKEMTLREKLAAMESLWEDLSRSPGKIPSPAWHKDVLARRRARVAAGKAKFIEWETAKQALRRRLK